MRSTVRAEPPSLIEALASRYVNPPNVTMNASLALCSMNRAVRPASVVRHPNAATIECVHPPMRRTAKVDA